MNSINSHNPHKLYILNLTLSTVPIVVTCTNYITNYHKSIYPYITYNELYKYNMASEVNISHKIIIYPYITYNELYKFIILNQI